MGTHSFYLPNDEESGVMRSLERTAKERDVSLSEVMLDIFKHYFRKQGETRGLQKNWTSRLCGSWKGEKKTKKLIQLIEKKRTRHKIEPFLS